MTDPRLLQYREAARAMARGHFQVAIPLESMDDVGRLGEALADLGHTLERKFEELTALARVTEQVNAGLLLDEVLEKVYASFRSFIPYDRIGFALLEDDGRMLRARWARTESKTLRIHKGYAARMEGSSLQAILETGQPRILNDLEAYLRQHPGSESTRLIVEEGMRASLTCPLVAAGKPVGFMFFSSMIPGAYADVHVALFMQIAGQLALILEKSKLYQQLHDLNDMKDRFLGMAVHDLRHPISVIQGYQDMLLAGLLGPVPEAQATVMTRIQTACKTMLGLVNDLLDVSAIQQGRLDLSREILDPTPLLAEVQENNALLARAKGQTLVSEVGPGLPPVSVDPRYIHQVLANLLSNAVKFSPSGTTITLAARHQGDRLVIEVRDQGPGIPAEDMPKVFTEFGRLTPRPTGGESSTGLGLAIVKRIVEAHGGTIGVESPAGRGCTFRMSLPAAGA